jgi:hypothetical protein
LEKRRSVPPGLHAALPIRPAVFGPEDAGATCGDQDLVVVEEEPFRAVAAQDPVLRSCFADLAVAIVGPH